MKNLPERKLNIHFIDGTSLKLAFPPQAEDQYKRKLITEEFIKKRVLILEADGGMHFIPFENIKYISIFPVPDGSTAGTIQGATFTE